MKNILYNPVLLWHKGCVVLSESSGLLKYCVSLKNICHVSSRNVTIPKNFQNRHYDPSNSHESCYVLTLTCANSDIFVLTYYVPVDDVFAQFMEFV